MWPLIRKQPRRSKRSGLLLSPLETADYRAAINLIRQRLPERMLLARSFTDNQSFPLRLKKGYLGVFRENELLAVFQVGSTMTPALAEVVLNDAKTSGNLDLVTEIMELVAPEMISWARECTSILGAQNEVELLWPHLEKRWPRVREFRPNQPLLEATDDPVVADHPEVRLAQVEDIDALYQASVRMFKEEVGRDPTRHDGGKNYRNYVGHLVRSQRSYIIKSDGAVIFKADAGLVFENLVQLHGIWVDPQLRGQGIGASAVVAATRQIMQRHAPRITLYVNDFNLPARRIYEKAGYREIGTLSTYLM